ncbi:glycosyltransferase family 39 protein, partial [Candidatus Gottesmanbacteria bacterium]|nr:glycosyltransferase family 39 protein [Candidatus Gottesmanbacteria bacterium]
ALRFYRLGDVPIGFHRDEAFLGYNAYSLYRTGRDMTGKFLPVHLESFLYSPAGYSYASIPFIAIFGLIPFSVRFASAFFGSLTILITFFLARELFLDKKFNDQLGLASAFFLAISPWHINLSRTATENTLVVFFIAAGVLLFFLWVKNRRWVYLLASFASFGITIGIYQAPRVFLLFFIPLLLFLFRKEVKMRTLISVVGLFIVVILFPLVAILKSPTLSLRIRTVSIFASSDTQLILDEQIREDGQFSRFTRFFHNKLASYGVEVLSNYFDHFSYRFLFTEHVLPMRYRIPGSGLVYLFELPLLLFGAWKLMQKNPKAAVFLFGWIAIAPVGSALTFDDIPNLQRTLLMFPAISIVSSYGFVSFFNFFPRFSRIIAVGSGMIVTWSMFIYLHQYYVHGIVHRPWYRQEGYRELVVKVNTLLPSYQKAIITNRETAPTIFFLFYVRFDPVAFQHVANVSMLRDFDRVGFANYEFSQEECPLRDVASSGGIVGTTGKKGTLYVNSGLCKDMKYGRLLSEVRRSDNSLVFKLYDFE